MTQHNYYIYICVCVCACARACVCVDVYMQVLGQYALSSDWKFIYIFSH
jgi:hypothetical protein